MRILILGGFAESLVNFRGSLIKALVEQGHQVFACAPDASDSLREKLAELGAEYRHVPLQRTGLNPFADLMTLFFIWRLCRDARPDVFLGYTIKPVLYGSLAAWLAGINRIYSMITGIGYAFTGDTIKRRLVSALIGRMFRLGLAHNHRIFFQNPDDIAEFRLRGLLQSDEQVVLINGSGVDINHFSAAPLPSHPVFLLVSRLIVDKGVREYAKAAALVHQKYPDVRFLLAGWIDQNPAAISQAELDAWVRDGAIEYLGYLDDVRPAIRACSIFVLPSYREGTPRTVLEAMAMGRAVVTTDAPGCRETVIDGKNGFLVPVKDAFALASAMGRFLDCPELIVRMGKCGRHIAEEKYDVNKVNAAILAAMGLAS